MAQVRTIVGICCSGGKVTLDKQTTIYIENAEVTGLMLYDPVCSQIMFLSIQDVMYRLRTGILIVDNIILPKSGYYQTLSPNPKNPAMSIPASPVGCTTCPIDKLPLYLDPRQYRKQRKFLLEAANQIRERYVLGRIVDKGKTIGYRVTQGYDIKEFTTEVLLEGLKTNRLTLCNAVVADNSYLKGKYTSIPEIQLSRVKQDNMIGQALRLPIVIEECLLEQGLMQAIGKPPLTMQAAQAAGYMALINGQAEVRTPFLLCTDRNRDGKPEIELITPLTQQYIQEYKDRFNNQGRDTKIDMPRQSGNSRMGRPVVRI